MTFGTKHMSKIFSPFEGCGIFRDLYHLRRNRVRFVQSSICRGFKPKHCNRNEQDQHSDTNQNPFCNFFQHDTNSKGLNFQRIK
jgi:hypothetical protein